MNLYNYEWNFVTVENKTYQFKNEKLAKVLFDFCDWQHPCVNV
jgi:hypothetical protein